MVLGSISKNVSALTAAIMLAVTTTPALAAKAKQAEAAPSLAGPAVLAVVSIRDQRISVYDAQGGAVRANVSSGQTDYETPVGVYSILQKNKDHYSNLYDDAKMPFMQRLTWSGIALHAGALPGYPASHGCVRLPHNFAESIFPLSKIGTRVIVARDDVAPVEITHPLLFKPAVAGLPATAAATPIAYQADEQTDNAPFQADLTNWPERQALLDSLKPDASEKAQVAEAAAPELDELKKTQKAKATDRTKTAKALKRAESAKRKADDWMTSAQRRVANAKSDKSRRNAESEAAKATAAAAKANEKFVAAKAADDAAGAELGRATAAFDAANEVKQKAVTTAKEAKRKMLPVSVFVSRETQRLYVRQGHEAVLDVPVTITDPHKPIGTHVYTAVDFKGDGNDVRWNVVTLKPREAGDIDDYYDPYYNDDPYYGRKKRKTAQLSAPPPTELGPATAALDRVTFPPEVVSQVSQYVWPGSSLIISDEEMSKETGEATDFVVLISGEPQGGIKKRPRQPPSDYYQYDPYYSDYYGYERRRKPQRYYSPFFSFW